MATVKFSRNPEINKIVGDTLSKPDAGWIFTTGKNHNKLMHKGSGLSLPIAKTPSDWRASQNLRSNIRQIETGTHRMITSIKRSHEMR